MRKIERDMIAAIRAGKNRTLGNTRIDCDMQDGPRVYLHGNHIATVHDLDPNSGKAYLSFTLAGWPTPTTRSRINALCREFGAGAGVWQSKGKQWAECPRFGVRDGAPREISPTEWVQA